MPSLAICNGNLAAMSRKGQAANRIGGKIELRRQAVALRQLAYDLAMELKECQPTAEAADGVRATAQAAASLLRAWDAAAERERIIRGEPLPGSLRPESKPKSRHSSSSPRIAPRPVAKPALIPVTIPVTGQVDYPADDGSRPVSTVPTPEPGAEMPKGQ